MVSNGPSELTWTDQVTDLVQDLTYSELPGKAVENAKLAFLDSTGVALAGWSEPGVGALLEHSLGVYRAGEATIIGTARRMSPVGSCLLNGTLIHALDYDDTAWSYVGHATAVLLPVCLAIGEERRLTGKHILTGYVVGFEVASLIGRDLFETLAPRGWHLTGVVGVFGATATAAKLLRLSKKETMNAFGIAASQAGGLKGNFGTVTKALHAGLAARAGLESALLASRGVVAASHIFDSKFGFFETYHGSLPEIKSLSGLRIVEDGLAYKKYPTCTGSHPAVDAVLDLQAIHRLQPADIEHIRCRMTSEVFDELIYPAPITVSQARFSLQFAVAVALVRGRLTLDELNESMLGDSSVRRLMTVCEAVPDDTLRRTQSRAPAASVEIRLVDGRRLHAVAEIGRGNPENPLSVDELLSKFSNCASKRLSAEAQVRELGNVLLHLDEVDDMSRLGRLMRK